MSMSRNFSTRGISSETRVILRDLTLIWHCAKMSWRTRARFCWIPGPRVEIEILIFLTSHTQK